MLRSKGQGLYRQLWLPVRVLSAYGFRNGPAPADVGSLLLRSKRQGVFRQLRLPVRVLSACGLGGKPARARAGCLLLRSKGQGVYWQLRLPLLVLQDLACIFHKPSTARKQITASQGLISSADLGVCLHAVARRTSLSP